MFDSRDNKIHVSTGSARKLVNEKLMYSEVKFGAKKRKEKERKKSPKLTVI